MTRNLILAAEDMVPAPDEWDADDEPVSIFDWPGFWTRMRERLGEDFRFPIWERDPACAQVMRGEQWIGVVGPGRIWSRVLICGAGASPLPDELWVISAMYGRSHLLAPFTKRGWAVELRPEQTKWIEWRVGVEVPTRAAMIAELLWLAEQELIQCAVEEPGA